MVVWTKKILSVKNTFNQNIISWTQLITEILRGEVWGLRRKKESINQISGGKERESLRSLIITIWRKTFGRKEGQKGKSSGFTYEAWPDENMLWHCKKSYFQKLKPGWTLENQKGKACVKVSHLHGFCINNSWFITSYFFLCVCSPKIWKLLRKRSWK